MHKHLLTSIAAAMLPLSAQGAIAQASGSYSYLGSRSRDAALSSAIHHSSQQSYNKLDDKSDTQLQVISAQHSLFLTPFSTSEKALDLTIQQHTHTNEILNADIERVNGLELVENYQVNELIIIDQAVPDKHLFYKALKPGGEIREIDSSKDGLEQLKAILANYQNLNALHIVSHADDGVVFLGSSNVNEELLREEVNTLATMNKAMKDGADVFFYGCNLAKSEKGEALLELIQGEANVDVAASNNLTGNMKQGGDWQLEIVKGDITSEQPFSDIAVRDFSHTLAPEVYTSGSFCVAGCGTPSTSLTSSDGHFVFTGNADGSGEDVHAYNTFRPDDGMYFDYQTSIDGDTTGSFNFASDGVTVGSFELTGLVYSTYDGGSCSGGSVVGYVAGGGTVSNSLTWSGTNTSATLSNFSGVQITHFTVNGSGCSTSVYQGMGVRSFTVDNKQPPTDSDGSLTAASTVSEPVAINTTVDSVGEAVDVFDFTLSDGGSSDGLAMGVSQIVLNVSGTTTDSEREKVTWRLNGNDVSNVTGVYNAGANTITFSGLGISVANSASEVYTINAYYNDNTGITDGKTFVLSVDGDTDLTVGSSGTQMAATSAVTNGAGGTFDVVATNVDFITQPGGAVSGVPFTTQPVVAAKDAAGNIDLDFNEDITIVNSPGIYPNGAGTVSNNVVAAVNGVSTFTSFTHTTVVDGNAVIFEADDESGVGSNLSSDNSNLVFMDVVATQLVFDTQPGPLSVQSNIATSFSTVPVISAQDGNGIVDTGYSTTITLAEVNGAGSALMNVTGDTDGSSATVSINPSSGVATFTGAQITYSLAGAANENFNIRASSGGLTLADSSQFTASYPTPTISSATYNANTKVLVVTGTNFVANGGGSDVDVSDLTLSGQSGGSRAIITSSDVDIDNANQFTVTLSGGDIAAIDALLNTNGTQSIDAVTYNLAAADDFITFLTDGDISDLTGNSVTASNVVDSDGDLTSASGVIEPIGLDTTVDSIGEAVNVFDFTLSDSGTADGSAMTVSQVVVNVSGTASDIERNQVTWRLNGNDVSNVTGVYNATADTITFSGLSISIADGTNEVYTVNAYYNDNTGITEDNTFVLSIDGDTDLTLGSGTQMASTSAVTNGVGGTFDVVSTALVVTTQPAGSVSGVALTTQPVITAQDAFGNTDVDFAETISLTEASAGALSGDTATASAGVATFSGLTYTATADQQSFTLTANDQDGVGSNLSIIDTNAVTSDVVATKLVFTTLPGPLSIRSAEVTNLSPVAVVSAQDAIGLVDTGYSTSITLAEVSGAGSATMSATGDADGSGATVTINPSAGVATFTSMQLTYTASGGADENFNLQASSGGLSTAISSQFTSGTFDSDASVTAASGVIEPVSIASVIDTVGEAIGVLDFTVNDGGTSDNKATLVTAIKIHVSGTASASKFTYLLSGPDANNVTGSLSAGVVTFSGLSISVANSQSEVYTVSAYYNDNSNLTEGQTLILSTDGDSDFTLATGYTDMAATSPINNSTGSIVDIIATELRFATQPAGAVSGVALTTQPVVQSTDAFGNLDTSFSEAITLTEASAGSLTNNTRTAVSGVATFTGLNYTATADQQSFTLTADDQTSVGSDFATIDANALIADVVATKLIFDSYLTPDVISSEQNPVDDSFTINNNEYLQPIVILAQDNNGLIDTGYSGDVTIAQGITNSGSALTMSTLNDIDGDAETITLTASNGQVSFTELNIAYKAASASDLLRLDISDNVASTSNTTGSNIAVNIAPYIKEQTDSFGPIDIDEDVKTALDTLDIQAYDADNNALVLTVNVDKGLLFAVDGDSVQGGVTIADSNGSAGSQAITLSGTAANINNFLDTTRFEYQTALNDTTAPTLTIIANDGVLNGANTLTEAFTITAINDAPVISGTPVTTVAEDSAYSFIPTVTDVDSGDSQSFTIANKPSWMSFDANTGELSGTPGDNDVGLFLNIVITVTDSENATASLTAFALEVTNVNDAPTISGTPSSAIAEDSLYSFTPTAIDVDSGDTLTFSITNKPSWMSFNTSTGLLSGVPSNDDVGTSTNIIISVMDSAGLNTSLNAFAITVANVNDAPVISGTPTTQVNEDSAYSFTPTVTDVDVADTKTFSIANKPSWASFNSTTGSLAGTPSNNDVGTSNNIVITVTDSGNATANLAAFSLTVVNVNDAPMISGTPITQVNEDSAYSFTPTVTDVDTGDTKTFSITNKPGWATFNTATGALTGTPSNNDVGTSNNIVIKVADSANAMVSLAAFSITVANVNDAPIISGTPATQVNEDSAYSFTPTVTDVDTGDTKTFTIINKPSWAAFNTLTGSLTGTPSNNDVGISSNIVIKVADSDNATASLAAFSLTVANVNDAPSISGTPTTQVDEDSAYSFSPTVTDVDTGDTKTFSITNKPSWARFNTATGELAGTPANDDVGTSNNIVIKVADSANATASLAAFSITVANINDAPIISGTPAIKVKEGSTYSFTPVVTDVDSGDSTIFSIVNKPSWATFNSTTGELAGTPDNNDVAITNNIVITVADSANATASLAAFNITVSNVNDAPIIGGVPASEVNEDSAYSFTPTVTDVDEGDVHSFSISGHPDWMLFDEETGSVSGTPVQDDVDVTSDITITVNDNSGAENATDSLNFSVVVNNINQEPTAVADRFELTLNDTNTYVLDVLNNDVDIDGDTLVITGATTSIGSVTHDGENLTVTTQAGFVGEMKLLYTITDGSDTFIDGTVALLISGELDTSVPVITVPENVEVNATGLYTKVDLGVATAVNSDGKPIAISLVNGNTLFKPGSHIAYWQATDPTTGLTSVASQQLIVNPLISLGKNQIVVEGKAALVNVILNGEAPNYPVIVTLNIAGSADDSDYVVASNEVIISSGKQAQLMVEIIQDNQSEGDETLTLSLNDGNVGSKSSHVITIVERNIAPAISLVSSQDNESRQVVTSTGGLVTVQATVSDANDDNVSNIWSYDSALNINQLDDDTLELDPSELSVGVYRVGITSTDDGMGNLATTKSLYLAVVASLVELTDIDTDGDRIPDNEEGYGDADQDGIPDFQDAIAECNVMPEQASIQDAFLVEGEPGICLRKGNTLAAGETGGLQLTNNDLENSIGVDSEAVFVSGIFDFMVNELPEAGQTYRIVIPQRQPLPTGAVYRKFSDNMGWGTFVEDGNNQLQSAVGAQGYCPPPGDSLWTTGLTEGHWCVQLTIEDGGPNDNDGISNGAIVDPGGVSVLLTDNALPVAQADSVRVKRNQAIVIDVLANDTDADQDILTVGTASATFGIVTITADNKLAYQSATNFVGQDAVVYSLSDGNGGTASSTVDITVYVNDAPIALDDIASTDDRTAIIIDVLTNDTDADGDSLVVISAIVDSGDVVINEDNTLTYTPASGFDGTALITYIVDDGQGDQASAQVSVTVKAYQSVTVKNKSKGGSMGLMIIVLAGVVLYRSRRKRSLVNKHIMQGAAALAVATSMNAAAAEPQWFLTGSIGKSQVSESINTPSNIGITSRDIDKSDASYSVGGGVKYDAFAFTVSYEQLGEASASFNGDTLNASSFHQALAESAPKLVDGISFQGQYTLWQNDVMHASLGLGLLAWELDYTSKLNDSVIEMDEDDIDLFYNLELGYALTEQVKVSLKASRYNLSVNDVNNIALGLTYHF